MKQNNISKGIIKTLCYSDIFDYPLRREEIYKYFIGDRTGKKEIYSTLSRMVKSGVIKKSEKFYSLSGKKSLPGIRSKRQRESRVKIELAKATIRALSYIPTIKMIGISGSLSMENADKRDDVDLFIITSSGIMWMTRFFVNLFLILLKKKRLKGDSFGINSFCPNMFLSEDNLKIRDENIFSAHEVVQMKPVVDKDKTYEKFLFQNRWVTKYLPNSIKESALYAGIGKRSRLLRDFDCSRTLVMTGIDKVFFFLQYSYMKKSMTSEKVSFDLAMFHPKDKTNYVIELFESKYKSYLFCLRKKPKHFFTKNQPIRSQGFLRASN